MSSASTVSFQGLDSDVRMNRRMSFSLDPQPLPNVPLIHRPGDSPGSALKRAPLEVRKRLLVVDDELPILKLVTRILPAHNSHNTSRGAAALPILKLVTRILAADNYQITSAGSGDEAAQMINAPGYPGVDLLVTDLMMPRINRRGGARIHRRR